MGDRDPHSWTEKHTEMPYTDIKFGIFTDGYYEQKWSNNYYNYEIVF
jgi:hypothetical protein